MATESLTRETLASGKEGVWDYISPSRLGLWRKCPLAFKLKYIDGAEPRPTPGIFIGRMVHKALERWYLHRQLDEPFESWDLGNWLMENWAPAREAEGVAFESTAEEEASRSQSVASVAAYLAQLPPTDPRPLTQPPVPPQIRPAGGRPRNPLADQTMVARVENHHYLPRSGRHFRRLFPVLRAYLDDRDRGRFNFRPGLGCHMCEHRNNRCRDWEG